MNEEFDPSLRIATAGEQLRDGRLAAGWSIDVVAQQLKLAPRQVQALEDDEFGLLPGRTFVRGFVRNYARLLRLDADAVLARLPDAVAAPSLDSPSLAPSPRVMGELPAYLNTKPKSSRAGISVALLAILAIAAAVEYSRPGSILSKVIHGDKAESPATAPVPSGPSPPSDASRNPATGLPNPLSKSSDSLPAGTSTEGKSELASPSTTGLSRTTTTTDASDVQLVLVFRGTSWVEVRDGKGSLVLSTIGYPGAAHTIAGAPPFDVVLGNAEAVTVTYRGAPFDSTPYIKQNVAKFSLR